MKITVQEKIAELERRIVALEGQSKRRSFDRMWGKFGEMFDEFGKVFRS